MLIKELIEKIKNEKNFYLNDILKEYKSHDWKEYIKVSDVTYNRMKIFENENFDVYIITWNKMQKANIHDHSKNGCWLKVLQGKLIEKIYDYKINIINTKTINEGDISFMKNNIGYHSIENGNDISVTLHVYSPPNHSTKFL
jgi:cysteine dioxygenase